jgi:hypothetical protein
MGNGRRAGEALHEGFDSILIVLVSGLVGDGYWDARRVLGCRYEIPRRSVGALRGLDRYHHAGIAWRARTVISAENDLPIRKLG